MIAGRRATPDWLGAQGSFLYPRRLPMPDGFIPHDVIREPTRCLCSLPTSVYTPATTKADILFPFFLFSSLSIKHINLNLTNPLSQPHLQLKQQLNTMVAKEMNALLYSEVRTPALPIVILNADLLILPDHLWSYHYPLFLFSSFAPNHDMPLSYRQPRKFEITKVPVPEIGPEEVLLKGKSILCQLPMCHVVDHQIVDICGVCGTDQHIHEGEFIAKFPVSPPAS